MRKVEKTKFNINEENKNIIFFSNHQYNKADSRRGDALLRGRFVEGRGQFVEGTPCGGDTL